MGWLLLGAAVGVSAVAVLAVLVIRATGDARTRAVADADGILDRTFSGAPTVTYRCGPAALPFATVVAGATARGYRLVAQSAADSYGAQELVFERQS